MYVAQRSNLLRGTDTSPDIIALLIVGVLLLVLFVFWERYLEKVHSSSRDECRRRWWTPPPLMPVSIWTRANGKLAVMLMIAFLEWCSFNSLTYWVQVRRLKPELRASCLVLQDTDGCDAMRSCTTRTISA